MWRPHEVVWRVYRALRDRGYDGPPPVFNDMWNRWFAGRGCLTLLRPDGRYGASYTGRQGAKP